MENETTTIQPHEQRKAHAEVLADLSVADEQAESVRGAVGTQGRGVYVLSVSRSSPIQ